MLFIVLASRWHPEEMSLQVMFEQSKRSSRESGALMRGGSVSQTKNEY